MTEFRERLSRRWNLEPYSEFTENSSHHPEPKGSLIVKQGNHSEKKWLDGGKGVVV